MTSFRDEQVRDPHALPIGAHLLTPKAGYTHQGIYIGDGRSCTTLDLSGSCTTAR